MNGTATNAIMREKRQLSIRASFHFLHLLLLDELSFFLYISLKNASPASSPSFPLTERHAMLLRFSLLEMASRSQIMLMPR